MPSGGEGYGRLRKALRAMGVEVLFVVREEV